MSETHLFRFKCFTHLLNFRSDVKEIALGDIKIIKFLPSEESYIRKIVQKDLIDRLGIAFSKMIYDPEYLNHSGFEFLIKFPYKHDVNNEINILPCVERASDVVTTLRLFKSGIVGANSLNANIVEGDSYLGAWIEDPLLESNIPKVIAPYQLLSDDVERFKNFFKEIRRYLPPSSIPLRRCIKWFNKYYSEIKEEDRFINLYFALEALYKSSGYKLSLRCAYNIGINSNDRESIVENLEKTYKQRNNIVHGSNSDRGVVAKLNPKLEEYTRVSIVKFLRSNDHKTLLENLDSKIRRGV